MHDLPNLQPLQPSHASTRTPILSAATVILLFAVYFILRLPHLRDLAVFCDEATYLDWARLIRQNPLANALVSMQDNKFPLHYWLLALAWPLDKDPVYMGRLLSVLLGALTIIPLLLLAKELAKLSTLPKFFPPLVAVLVITSPMVAFNQRLALAESLLLLESIIIAWLSLRLADRITNGIPISRLLLDGFLLGLIWAATLITKQNFSYALWSLPFAAFLVHLPKTNWTLQLKRFLIPISLATAIGLICFVPILLRPSPRSLLSRILYKGEFLGDYQARGRVSMICENFVTMFIPRANEHLQWWPYDPNSPLDQGWLYLYLTPPLFLLAILGAGWMIYRRAWKLLFFLGTWTLSLLASLLISNHSFSRYCLLGCIPVLIFAAWIIADLLRVAAARSGKAWLAVAILVTGAIIAYPIAAVTASLLNSRAPVLTRGDRYQHLSGFPCGYAGQCVVERLKQLADKQPITVVTNGELGTNNEYIWLMLRNAPNIRLFRDDTLPPLRSAGSNPNTYLALTEQWNAGPPAPVVIPADCPIYYIAGGESFSPAILDSDSRLIDTFQNPPDIPGDPPSYEIAIFEILTTRFPH